METNGTFYQKLWLCLNGVQKSFLFGKCELIHPQRSDLGQGYLYWMGNAGKPRFYSNTQRQEWAAAEVQHNI